jgi:hypothetical protein
MKRYFALKYLRVQGYLAVTQLVLRVYIAALIVVFIRRRTVVVGLRTCQRMEIEQTNSTGAQTFVYSF